MANASYQTREVTMAHCPNMAHAGKYSEVPGDSILGIYGTDFFKFEQGKLNCDSPPCSYCERHKVADLYFGPFHLRGAVPNAPTYGSAYMGVEQVYQRNPWENIPHDPCQK